MCGGQVPNDGNVQEVEGPIGDEQVTLESDIVVDEANTTTVSLDHPPVQGSQASTPSAPFIFGTQFRGLRQLSMQEGMNTAEKQSLDRTWANAFYEANIPFNVVRHPTFVEAVKRTAAARLAYKPPSYYALRTTLLKARKAQLEEEIQARNKDSIRKYGVTVCSDGWDNVQNRPLLNVLMVSPKGETFMGSIDTSGNKKDADYIAGKINSFVDKVGPTNVVQICSDNASAMLAASRVIRRTFPHIYVQGCAAHCLDLLLEDWGKERWVKILVKKAKSICFFIKHHHASQALYRRYSPDHVLRTPVETRFATNFIMIERLVAVKGKLERMLLDQEWQDFLADLYVRNKKSHKNGLSVRRSIRSDAFWNTCDNFLHMVTPVLKVLRIFDGKEPALGIAWLVMQNLRTHVSDFVNPPFNLTQELAESALSQFDERWTLMKTDLHWAGAMLNPFLRTMTALHDNGTSRPILNKVLSLLAPNEESYLVTITQYQDFIENRAAFSDAPPALSADMPPHEWWDAFGGGAVALQQIARRILAQVCSASSCERNWSMYSFVHSKVRNRLTPSRAEDLVYIYTNSKLTKSKRGTTPAKWYGLNVFSDDEDEQDLYPEDDDGDGQSLGNDGDELNADNESIHSSNDGCNTSSEDGEEGNEEDSLQTGIYDFHEDDDVNFARLCSGEGNWRMNINDNN